MGPSGRGRHRFGSKSSKCDCCTGAAVGLERLVTPGTGAMDRCPFSGAITVPDDKYNFFINDLMAAAWVIQMAQDGLPNSPVDKFLILHDKFLKRLGRTDKGLFSQISETYLSRIIAGWIRLYRLSLDELRSRFPRMDGTADLKAMGINWSKRLEINASGLIQIDGASRYAEYWAERSVRSPDHFDTLGDRESFIGSEPYLEYTRLVYCNHLLILDRLKNGVPSYDFFKLMAEKNALTETQVVNIAAGSGWDVVTCEDNSFLTILSITKALQQGGFVHGCRK